MIRNDVKNNFTNYPRVKIIPGKCTFNQTGKNYGSQFWWRCETCWPNDQTRGCCSECAKTCHIGHNLVRMGIGNFFCDCGAGDGKQKCKLCKKSGKSSSSNTITSLQGKIAIPKKELDVKNNPIQNNLEKKKTIVLPNIQENDKNELIPHDNSELTFITQVGYGMILHSHMH
ncbi:hypothetical protein TRFO_16791 [Tritrichomonas foetus]|uniref:UBR-type domain-containing protein n=1 Tax=Tritrichomonas foetus TaxID=1144522 RepID=A0A1J4KPV0_9EUKA|nr:hypothetical protein TRFO_16791 [Tritrichomonas foetus]|eukprot:OHT13138.1 hypothetical protein TRFO_16791 [Tritrichomonas foetus]